MNNKKTIAAALSGNVIEFYDFTLYGFFAPLFADLFFPAINPNLALLSTLGIFAASFVIRPFGGIVFGHIGDKYGRRTSLSASILLMSVATFSIAVLPTYDHVGIIASISLCFFRLLQGFSTGGEFNGAFIFLIEHSQNEKAGLLGSFVMSSAALGAFLAVVCGAIVTKHHMPDWSWRIPFLIGSVVGIFGLYLRRRVGESPEFLQMRKDANPKYPFIQAFKEDWVAILRTTGASGFCIILVNMLIVYVNVYLNKNLGFALSDVFRVNTIAILVLLLLTPFIGRLSDKVGQIPIMKFTALSSLFLAYPLFILINTSNLGLILLSEIILSILTASYSGAICAYQFKMFPVNTRYSGTAFSFCIASAILGGSTPILLTYLIQITGNLMLPAIYLGVFSLVGLFSVLGKDSFAVKMREPLRTNF